MSQYIGYTVDEVAKILSVGIGTVETYIRSNKLQLESDKSINKESVERRIAYIKELKDRRGVKAVYSEHHDKNKALDSIYPELSNNKTNKDVSKLLKEVALRYYNLGREHAIKEICDIEARLT